MSDAPYMLSIHLHTGQVIELHCEGYEIVPPGIDEHGHDVPMALNYTPVDAWQRTLAFIDFRAVAAIEVQRTPALALTE